MLHCEHHAYRPIIILLYLSKISSRSCCILSCCWLLIFTLMGRKISARIRSTGSQGRNFENAKLLVTREIAYKISQSMLVSMIRATCNNFRKIRSLSIRNSVATHDQRWIFPCARRHASRIAIEAIGSGIVTRFQLSTRFVARLTTRSTTRSTSRIATRSFLVGHFVKAIGLEILSSDHFRSLRRSKFATVFAKEVREFRVLKRLLRTLSDFLQSGLYRLSNFNLQLEITLLVFEKKPLFLRRYCWFSNCVVAYCGP